MDALELNLSSPPGRFCNEELSIVYLRLIQSEGISADEAADMTSKGAGISPIKPWCLQARVPAH